MDLNRRFRIVGDDEQADDIEQFAGLFGRDHGEGWDSLLRSKRVVVLAEAGAGKTTELRAQANRINNGGGEAFFVPIERLNNLSLADAIDAADSERFSSWLQGEPRPATFFLDAVDELKLVRGNFSTALHRIRRELADVLDRVQLVVSSRPGDWLGKADLEEVRATLPPARRIPLVAENHSDPFIEAIRGRDQRADGVPGDEDESQPSDVIVAALLPLDRKRAIRLLGNLNVANPDEAATQLDDADAWDLTRTPLGVIHVAEYWSSHASIGTRAQQLGFSTQQSVLDREDRQQRDDNPMPASELLAGGERLALGLLLAQQRSLARTKRGRNSLDESSAECLLPNWSPRNVERLVNTSLFVPSAIDRIQFRHRAIQEYLAAKMLDRLASSGSRRIVHQVLFSAYIRVVAHCRHQKLTTSPSVFATVAKPLDGTGRVLVSFAE